MKDGRYLECEEYQKSAESKKIEYLKIKEDFSFPTVKLLKQEINNRKEKVEGYVLRLKNGLTFKLKSKFYFESTVNCDLIAQNWQIWRLILKENIDDFKSSLIKKVLKNRVENFTKIFTEIVQQNSQKIHSFVVLYTNSSDYNVKPFAQWSVENNVPFLDHIQIYLGFNIIYQL